RVLRTPERAQHPAVAFAVEPGRERSPNAGRSEVDVFIAERRGGVKIGAMIAAANTGGIHHPQAAFLAAADHQLFALVLENDRSHLRIEIALSQPIGVWRAERVI